MPYLQNAGAFLITSIFGFFICLFLIRMMLIAVGAPFNMPVCRFVYELTNPLINPLRGTVPRWRRIEFASLLIVWLLGVIELALLVALFAMPIGVVGVLVHALVDMLDWAILIQLVAIIVFCILSFSPAVRTDPNYHLLVRFTAPVVRPFRRFIPPVGGFDFSCWAACIALILLRLLVVAPLTDLSMQL
ncbi:MAG TPA: YggT family protein [Rudaea sp.]|nr:YggT family protein [Rudaea sp.]